MYLLRGSLMIKANQKNIFIVSLILLIPFYLVGCESINEKTKGATEIFEIPNTEEIFVNPDSPVVTVRKHFMILYPPEDLIELKELVEKYIKDHPIEDKINVVGGKNRVFEIKFYRESDDLPRDWQPVGDFISDRIEHHKNDLIASIIWSDTDPQKEYYNYDKSKDGKVIKKIRFIEDQIIE